MNPLCEHGLSTQGGLGHFVCDRRLGRTALSVSRTRCPSPCPLAEYRQVRRRTGIILLPTRSGPLRPSFYGLQQDMSVLLLVCGTTYVRDVRFATCDAYESAAESQAITNSDNGTRASKPAVAKVINHVQITWIRDGRQQHQPQWRARHAERARFPKSERDPQRRLGRRADHRAGRIAIPSRRRCADSGNRHRDLQKHHRRPS